jgi:6-phosphofructokinase 1
MPDNNDRMIPIPGLGEPRIDNPLDFSRFTDPDEEVAIQLTDDERDVQASGPRMHRFEPAGPRQRIFFDPPKVKCAIVTCGGLCPGVNDVIRAIVMEAHHNYRVACCVGVRFGLEGLIPKYGHDVMELTPDNVSDIHQFGGTILGSSRGPQPPEEMVDALERMNVSVVFLIGGDGTMRAAEAIQAVVAERRLKIAVIGIPKTIDNDIHFVSRSFGFDTAVEKATESINCAHAEAVGAFNGIGMVKVMGREAGFIAAQATLALKVVNFVLVPEEPFELHGERGLLTALEKRLESRRHAVIVVAEGAGQHLLEPSGRTDASGNQRLGDVAGLLRSEIGRYFADKGRPITLKFIDPSYIIRSVPANANDRVYCGFLGQHAVHAAMAGKTGMVVSKLQDRYVHVPLSLITRERKHLNIRSDYWRAVLASTGQRPLHAPREADAARAAVG